MFEIAHDCAPEPTPEATLPLTLADWLNAYQAGADPRTLLSRCLARAQRASPPAAWIHLADDVELAPQLAALDVMLASVADRAALLERYPLFGVPYALKDNIDVEGVATTAACPAYAHLAPSSAAVVRRLAAAGAVWLGKTNLDQFATGLVGTRSPYGQPSSAFDADYVSGGSSSGSAVVVAAGLVPFALGTDTAGSGRIPAAFNQLVGLKPTPGRVGTSGVLPACRTLDCVSILALTVDDAAHVLSVIEGDDANDDYSDFAPGIASWPTGPLRIGVPRDVRLGDGSGYQAPYAAALEFARALGHEIVALDFAPLHQTAELLYAGPWVAERHSVVADLLHTQPTALDPAVREVIGAATRFSATDTFRAQYALKSLTQETTAIWNDVDLLLVPSAPNHPRLDAVAADPIAANSALGTYTNFVNLLGWCALAVPAGTTAGGLPFGVTLIAPAHHDAALARFGSAWQGALDLPLGASAVRPSALAAPCPPLRPPAVEKTLALAVVGAHLSGMPLNGQLLERGARLLQKTTTAPHYRLYALPATTPAKPGLVRSTRGGQAIEVEVWAMPLCQVGSFLALIPAPLGLGSLELADGRWVHGFLCESHAVENAHDVSHFSGWRHYIAALAANPPGAARQNA